MEATSRKPASAAPLQSSFTYEELLKCGEGTLYEADFPKLPAPPMLMFDRISHVGADDGAHGKGSIVAELDVRPDLWFFACHFKGDPVMPGCLGLDALWQLTGFYLGWSGGRGLGRAIGVGEVKLTGMILPTTKKVTYKVDLKRLIVRKLIVGVADGEVWADDAQAFEVKDMKVGVVKPEA